jgi:HK97 family phage major capsid protein
MGAALDSDYQGSADYFKSIWHLADRGNAQIADKLRAMRNAFSSTVPSEGGFLIPETLRSELLRISLETSIVRPRARVIPMESRAGAVPGYRLHVQRVVRCTAASSGTGPKSPAR